MHWIPRKLIMICFAFWLSEAIILVTLRYCRFGVGVIFDIGDKNSILGLLVARGLRQEKGDDKTVKSF